MSRTWLENNKSVRCQLIQLTFSNALKPVAKRIWTSDPSLRRRVLYPAELWRHMPQTLDFTGFLGFFPSAIYKIINSFFELSIYRFFRVGNIRTFPKLGNALLSPLAFFRIDSNWKLFFIFSLWGMPRLSLRRRVLYPAELWRHMPQTLDFTGFLGFFPSAIYKIINSFFELSIYRFFRVGNIRTFPKLGNALLSPLAFFRIDSNWKLFFIFSPCGMPRLSLRRRTLYPTEVLRHIIFS